MVLVLFGVDAETLGDEVYIDAVNVLDQTSDWWHDLLRDVPLDVDFYLAFLSEELVRAVGLLA